MELQFHWRINVQVSYGIFLNIYYSDYINLFFMYGQQITFQCVIIIFIGTSHSTIAIIFSSIHFNASYIYQLAVFDEYTRHSLLFEMRFRNLRSNVIINKIIILIEKFQCRTKRPSSDDGINVVLKHSFAPIQSHYFYWNSINYKVHTCQRHCSVCIVIL